MMFSIAHTKSEWLHHETRPDGRLEKNLFGENRHLVPEYPIFLSSNTLSCRIDFSDPTILDVNNRTFNPDYDVERYDFKNEWSTCLASHPICTLDLS